MITRKLFHPWIFIYISTIVAINYGFSAFPPWVLPWGDILPPFTFAVGAVFVIRDYVQRASGHYVIVAIMIASVLSYIMVEPIVAVASLSGFLFAELADWLVYSILRRPFHQRIIISSMVSAPVDTLVFLPMIGVTSPTAIILMIATKMVAALIVYVVYEHRSERY